jgi:hypothetical protein
MILPLWALFGAAAAIFSACMMLLQEKLHVNPYAVAFWVKIACAAASLPFVIYYGPATDPIFYFYLALTAILYAISDIVFYTGVNKSGAGAVARLVPVSSVLGFLLWFAVDPDLLEKYISVPIIFSLIFFTLCLFSFFAFRLKKCEITMGTLRSIWYVLFAATIGPIFTKLVAGHAPREIAIFSYVFFQALMMMTLWLCWLAVRRPVPFSDIFNVTAARGGLIVGMVSAAMVLTKFASVTYVDNPAYIPAIIALDSVLILGFYKAAGWKIEGDIKSGLGIVACVIALIILKAQID